MAKKKWKDLTDGQRAGLVALIAVQLSLAVSAWADLASRNPSQVRGKKGTWAAVIAVNFVGPILYFTRGRR